MYKIKHIPSGYYFQPHKHRGSHLSKNGKIYQTKINGLTSAFKCYEKYKEFRFSINCEKDSQIHKNTIDLDWKECSYNNQLKLETKYEDWEIEDLK